QLYGTSSTSAGYVTVNWTSTYTETYDVAALGANEDPTLYVLTVDSTTQQIPSSVISSNAVMNWVAIEYFSPLNITYNSTTFPIVYNSTTNTFGVSSSSSLSFTANSAYLNSVPAPFAVFKFG
ncbi:MAG: hypothetical protein ACP5MB_11525, partial [bacterium]